MSLFTCHMAAVSPLGVALESPGRGGPSREGETMDFGVVADVDRKAGVKVEELYFGGVLVLQGKGPQLAGERARLRGVGGSGFDHDGRTLPTAFSEADQRTAGGPVVPAEHLFARFRVQGARRRFDPLRQAAAKPEPSCFIAVAAITHAVPYGALLRRNSRFQVRSSKSTWRGG